MLGHNSGGQPSVRMQGRAWPLKLLASESVIATCHGGPECALSLMWGGQVRPGADPAAETAANHDIVYATGGGVRYAVRDRDALLAMVSVLYLACHVLDGTFAQYCFANALHDDCLCSYCLLDSFQLSLSLLPHTSSMSVLFCTGFSPQPQEHGCRFRRCIVTSP